MDTGGFEFGDPGSSTDPTDILIGLPTPDYGSGDFTEADLQRWAESGGSSGLDLSSLTNFLKGVGGIFKGNSGQLAQLAAFGGLGTLLSRMGQSKPDPVGYQGGIPLYTATRMQTPIEQQRPTTTGADGKVIPYRPGQGGITYFTPMQYNYQGRDITAPTMAAPVAPTTTPAPSTGKAGSGTPIAPDVPFDATMPVMNTGGGSKPADSQTLLFAGGGATGIATLAKGGNAPRYLRGPGDGVSDDIKAKFDHSGEPARLADGEFVIDARTVSEIGNGSSEAGARKLYAMMDRVHAMRKKAKRGKPSGADRELNKLA